MPRSFLKTVKVSKRPQRYASSPSEYSDESSPASPGIAVTAEPRTGSAFTPVTPKNKGKFVTLLFSFLLLQSLVQSLYCC